MPLSYDSIILIAYHFHPSGEIGARRVTKLARFLAAEGFRVFVVSPFAGANIPGGGRNFSWRDRGSRAATRNATPPSPGQNKAQDWASDRCCSQELIRVGLTGREPDDNETPPPSVCDQECHLSLYVFRGSIQTLGVACLPSSS